MEEMPVVEVHKIIHFIWAGGEKGLNRESRNTIVDWARANPHWQIHIWVDRETSPDPERSFSEDFRSDLDGLPDSEEIFRRIEIIDIKKNKYRIDFRDSFVAYEVEKFFPNYGASSDFLRYHILYEIGGAYFDTDVFPGATSLDDILHEFVRHTLYLDVVSQRLFEGLREEEIRKILESFVIYAAGNDAFICTKNNPLMKRFRDEAKSNYEKVSRDQNERLRAAYGSKNIREFTVLMSGPGMVDRYIKENQKEEDGCVICENTVLKRARDGKVELVKPAPVNNASWLSAKLYEYRSEESYLKILERVEKVMRFECEKFGAISLDELICDMTVACTFISPQEVEQRVVLPVLARCDQVLSENKRKGRPNPLMEITGRYESTMRFANEHGCFTLFELPEEAQIEGINHLLRGWVPGDPEAELPLYILKNLTHYVQLFKDKIEFFDALLFRYGSKPDCPQNVYNCLQEIFQNYLRLITKIVETVEQDEVDEKVLELQVKLQLLLKKYGFELVSNKPQKGCNIF